MERFTGRGVDQTVIEGLEPYTNILVCHVVDPLVKERQKRSGSA
jgi:hypothetical protein